MGWVNIVHVYILHAKRSTKVRVAAIQRRKFTKSDALLKPTKKKKKTEMEQRVYNNMTPIEGHIKSHVS